MKKLFQQQCYCALFLTSSACLLSSFSYAKQAPSEPSSRIASSQQVSVEHYQEDWNNMIAVIQQVDVPAMTMLTQDDQEPTEEQLETVSNAIRKLNESINKVTFITPEGKKAKDLFIAYNDDSLSAILKYSELKDNAALQQQLSQKSYELNTELVKALQNLQMRAQQ